MRVRLPLCLGVIMLAATSVAAPPRKKAAPKPEPAAATPAAPAPMASTSGTLNSTLPAAGLTSRTLTTSMLLANPLAGRPELMWLQERRNWAAKNAIGPHQLDQVAEEFSKREAWYPAIEMLWLAEKMTNDAALRKQYNVKMATWQGMKKPVEDDVDAAVQMWGGGKPKEAFDQLAAIQKAHPFSELAHLKTGFLYLQSYRSEEAKSEKLLEPVTRARVFRACYEQFCSAIVIDPLLADGYEYMNQSRELLPDQPNFLKLTNALTEVSFSFKSTLPALGKLDDGDRSPKALEDAADGLAKSNVPAYAALLYRAALSQPGLKATDAERITGSLNKTLAKIPKAGQTAADATPAAAGDDL